MFLFTPTAALAVPQCHCFPAELPFPNLGIPISLSDRIFQLFLFRCAFIKCHYRISQEKQLDLRDSYSRALVTKKTPFETEESKLLIYIPYIKTNLQPMHFKILL